MLIFYFVLSWDEREKREEKRVKNKTYKIYDERFRDIFFLKYLDRLIYYICCVTFS